MGLRSLALCSAVLALAAVACTSFSADMGASDADTIGRSDGGGGDDDAQDGGAVSNGDASGDDASDDGFVPVPDAGPNMLTNGDFEMGCANWDGSENHATTQADTTARTGYKSCRVCADKAGDFGVAQVVYGTSELHGEQYAAEAYLRTAPNSGAPPTGLTLTWSCQSGDDPDGETATLSLLTDTWQDAMGVMSMTNPDGGTGITLTIKGTAAAAGDCFLVDDARLWRSAPP